MSAEPPGPIEFIGTNPEDTEMAIGPVRLPGVYSVTETGPGMTAKYMAEQRIAKQGPGAFQNDQQQQDPATTNDRGTLLIAGEPVLNNDGARIIISHDELTETTYLPDQQRARILADKPDTEVNERGWVVNAAGDRMRYAPASQPSDDPQSGDSVQGSLIKLVPGQYTVATGENADEAQRDSEQPANNNGDTPSGDPDGDGRGTGGPPQTGPGGGLGPVEGGSQVDQVVPEGWEAIDAPSVSLTVRAYCTDATWTELDDLRDHERPFDVAIGEFTIRRMGILDVSRSITAERRAANDVTIKLKQFREVTVQRPGAPQARTNTGSQTNGDTTGGAGSVKGWVDANHDGIDDVTDQPIPDFNSFTVPGGTQQLPVTSGWSLDFAGSTGEGAFTDVHRFGNARSVSNPSLSGDGALAVDISGGGHYGAGATWDPPTAGQGTWQQMLTDYWLYIEPPVSGEFHTKLWSIHNAETDPSGKPTGAGGWASRLAIKNQGGTSGGVGLETYFYHMDQTSYYGEHADVGVVPLEQWVHVQHYVKMNTTSGGSGNNDGVAKIWLGGQLGYSRSNLRWTDDPQQYSPQFNAVVYYGGNGTAPSSRTIYFDELDVFNGEFGSVL